jgi:hypothetical protein
MFEELCTLVFVELRGATWSGIVVGGLLDRFFSEPIEPVANRLFYDTMSFSQSLQFIALLSTDCSKNAFPRNLSLCPFTEILKFFQSDIV